MQWVRTRAPANACWLHLASTALSSLMGQICCPGATAQVMNPVCRSISRCASIGRIPTASYKLEANVTVYLDGIKQR